MSEFETRVLDLLDLGLQPEAIAAELAVALPRVRRVISAYADDGAHDRASIAAAMGSEALFRAQLRAGQHSLPVGVANALIIALRISPLPQGARS